MFATVADRHPHQRIFGATCSLHLAFRKNSLHLLYVRRRRSETQAKDTLLHAYASGTVSPKSTPFFAFVLVHISLAGIDATSESASNVTFATPPRPPISAMLRAETWGGNFAPCASAHARRAFACMPHETGQDSNNAVAKQCQQGDEAKQQHFTSHFEFRSETRT